MPSCPKNRACSASEGRPPCLCWLKGVLGADRGSRFITGALFACREEGGWARADSRRDGVRHQLPGTLRPALLILTHFSLMQFWPPGWLVFFFFFSFANEETASLQKPEAIKLLKGAVGFESESPHGVSVLTVPPALSSLYSVSVGRLLSFSESQLYHQKNRSTGY